MTSAVSSIEMSTGAASARWTRLGYHRRWLEMQANRIFDCFQHASVNPRGGFYDLDQAGRPLTPDSQVRPLHIASRAVHCFAIGTLLGRPGAADVVDHGMTAIWKRHRDDVHGGYIWSFDDNGPVDTNKQGYGHAFVLLAASSAKVVGHPLADQMLADITEVLETRFWEPQYGAIREEFSADWQPLEGGTYRGQNSNMHLTEALMAAFEVTGERHYLDKAESIADLIIRRSAGSKNWRVAEHFHADWTLDVDYWHPNEMFRPVGTTPGHSLEWVRLVLQLWALGGRRHDWMPAAAKGLFDQAMKLGWDKVHGGFFYTLDWNDRPDKRQKLWWPAAEGVGAAHFLNELQPDAAHEAAYRQICNLIERAFIDPLQNGWREELTETLEPSFTIFPGKGDIYHALQACLIPLLPATGSIVKGLVDGHQL